MAVCVAGSMRDPTDYSAAYGADPPADAPLKRKLRRLLQQKEGLSAAEARDRARAVLLAAKTGRTESFVATVGAPYWVEIKVQAPIDDNLMRSSSA